jgi:hypothetical protein
VPVAYVDLLEQRGDQVPRIIDSRSVRGHRIMFANLFGSVEKRREVCASSSLAAV